MISLELSKTFMDFMYLTTQEFKIRLEVALLLTVFGNVGDFFLNPANVKTARTAFISVSDSSSVGEISPVPFTLSNKNIQNFPPWQIY